MAYLATVYATDEDVFVRAPADFWLLTPDDQKLVEGGDGTFEAGDRWTLRSASVDFEDAGVRPGHVCRLKGPGNAFGPLRGSVETFAVASVAGGSLALRRLGKPAGEGKPPAPPEGLAEVGFLVRTLDPQIEEASWDLNERFGIDESIPESAPTMLARLRELRRATVDTVLADIYGGMVRDGNEDFAKKAKKFEASLEGLLARLTVHWRRREGPEVSNRFSTRLVR